jgi:hypothetical protein
MSKITAAALALVAFLLSVEGLGSYDRLYLKSDQWARPWNQIVAYILALIAIFIGALVFKGFLGDRSNSVPSNTNRAREG